MKRSIFSMAALIGLIAFSSACAGIGSTSLSGDAIMNPIDIPGTENGLTEAGNPTEEEAEIKGIYLNDQFNVRIRYPETWEVDERNELEALFSSPLDESITASFIWLEAGDTLESFLNDVRGGDEGLVERNNVNFDKSLCTEISEVETIAGMATVECYHYKKLLLRAFVTVLTGVIEIESDQLIVEYAPDSSKGKEASGFPVMELKSEMTENPDLPVMQLRPEMAEKPERPLIELAPIKKLRKVEQL